MYFVWGGGAGEDLIRSCAGIGGGGTRVMHRLIHSGGSEVWLFRKRDRASPADVAGLSSLVQKLQLHVDALDDQLDALKAQHLSLRGRVYALWGRETPERSTAAPAANGDRPSAGATRDELRASLTRAGRFVPGKPPVHE